MRAAVLTAPGRFDIADRPLPEPGPGQVRIRVEGCGLCGSNLPAWEGRPWFTYPFAPGAPGHEAWGVVDAAGAAVSGVREGERVAFLSGHALAQYDVAAAAEVLPLPAALAAEPAPAEPLGCAFNVFRRSGIGPGQTVAVVGVGFLGAVVIRLAHLAGARVIALGRRPFALELGRRFGAGAVVPMDDHRRVIERVEALTGGRLCDVAVEAVGAQWPLDLAAELTRERGRLVIAGYHQDGPRQVNLQLWNWRGLDVVNAHERDPRVYLEGMRAAVAAVAEGRLDPRPLYTHRFALGDLDAAFEAMRTRPDGFLKALVIP
ncbi:MDR/zinc-dependent alcohol dehydrogenase-like family protein [Anaeromyxobacter paludicola]|uniref:Oxidoreductase n=1 Tax=Anaeromyxobacter paludicola TaxID=2918171 RepID=A0ABM7X6M2_9BACT|nr:zinc-binding dehydrogenase [Anaeromyxobacter paludicola]BDG07481.1 oxidoreductase [Anaeromyxobacter paludicola]